MRAIGCAAGHGRHDRFAEAKTLFELPFESDQFGKIVLGFFGDEPDYSSSIPWTPKLLEEFQARKGYDLKPYIPRNDSFPSAKIPVWVQ